MSLLRAGNEILVNTVTANYQIEPTITRLSNGGFVVSWQDLSGDGVDTGGFGIKAQIFGSDGAKVGDEFLVNTETFSDQSAPAVAGLESGGFVVAWHDKSGVGGDASEHGVKAQIFDAAGEKIGEEFLANTEIANSQFKPTVTGIAGGGFVVSWEDYSSVGDDQSNSGIKAQIFDAAGVKVGSELLVNTQTANQQYLPVVTSLAGGGFVISWQSASGEAADTSGYSIKGQIFDPAGGKVGGEFLVNTESLYDQADPTVTSLTGGGFVVSWVDASNIGGDGTGYGIKAQIFGTNGDKVGGEFLINTETLNDQVEPTITSLTNGGFVISWADYSLVAPDGSGSGIKTQVFNAVGGKVGDEFLVNTETFDDQSKPTITGLANDSFVVSWQDRSSQGKDTSGSGIKAQVFTLMPPVITAVSVPNAGMHIGDEVTATITVDADSDTYTLGAGSTIAGYALGSLAKANDTTYTAKFTVTAGTDVAASASLPVNVVLTNSALNSNPAYVTPIAQAGDAIDATRPTFIGAAANGTQLVLTYSETMDAAHAPSPSDFTVTATMSTIAVSSVAVDALDKTVTLTLASAILHGQSVTVAYTDPTTGDDTNAVQDAAGNDATTLGAIGVMNITPMPDVMPPLAPMVALANDTGISTTDHVTQNDLLLVTTSEPGGTVEYAADGGTYTTTAPVYAQDGTADGVHSLLVRHTDAAGNASVAAAFSFVLDTTAPALPAIGGLTADSDTGLVGDATTTRTTPTLTGMAEAGSVVTLYDSDGTTVLGTGTAGADGAWAVTSTALSLGDHSLTARATDVAGNLSGASASLVVNIAVNITPMPDVMPPLAPMVALANDTGFSATDHVTRDGMVTVMTSEPGGTVEYSTDSGNTYSTTAPVYAQDGSGDGVRNLLVKHTDAAGNASVATAFSFVLDTTAPALPVIGGLAADSDTGLVGDATTTRTTPTLTGTAEAGSVVTLYDSDGTTVLGTGTAGANAAWAVTSTALSLSDHSLTAWVTDVAGNLSDVSASLVVNIAAFDLPVVYVTGSQGSSQVKVSFYEGPVTYLKYEFLGSGGGEAVQATDDNDFVNLLGGDDAANGGAGDDVLDGGTGSNFLTGSAGRDVFFLDGRGGDTTWSTITDWTAGEQLAVWGWRPGVSKASWVGQAGAEGYQGVTMHADLDGNGVIDTSVTWAGHTRADLPTPTEQDGLLWFA